MPYVEVEQSYRIVLYSNGVYARETTESCTRAAAEQIGQDMVQRAEANNPQIAWTYLVF